MYDIHSIHGYTQSMGADDLKVCTGPSLHSMPFLRKKSESFYNTFLIARAVK